MAVLAQAARPEAAAYNVDRAVANHNAVANVDTAWVPDPNPFPSHNRAVVEGNNVAVARPTSASALYTVTRA